MREIDLHLCDCGLFSDKVYADAELKSVSQKHGIYVTTPYKRKRDEEETVVPTLYNLFVSRIGQPIESLFG